MTQTYSTRHLTARDHQLIDALERDPRYAKIANLLRPKLTPKPKASATGHKAEETHHVPIKPVPEPAQQEAPAPVSKPPPGAVGAMGTGNNAKTAETPKPTPKPGAVGAMGTDDLKPKGKGD